MTSHRLKAENAAAPSRRTKRKEAAAALTKRLPLDRESLKFLKPPFVAEAFLRLVDSRGKSVGKVDLRVDRGYFGNHMIIRDAQGLIIPSGAHASVMDDTEVVPPKSKKPNHPFAPNIHPCFPANRR